MSHEDQEEPRCLCVELIAQVEKHGKALESSCEIHQWVFVDKYERFKQDNLELRVQRDRDMWSMDNGGPSWAELDNVKAENEELSSRIFDLEVKLVQEQGRGRKREGLLEMAAKAGPLPTTQLAVPGLTAPGEIDIMREELADAKNEINRLRHDRDRLMRDRER